MGYINYEEYSRTKTVRARVVAEQQAACTNIQNKIESSEDLEFDDLEALGRKDHCSPEDYGYEGGPNKFTPDYFVKIGDKSGQKVMKLKGESWD